MKKIEQMLVQLSKGKALKTEDSSTIKVLKADISDTDCLSSDNSDSSNISRIEKAFENLKLNLLKKK